APAFNAVQIGMPCPSPSANAGHSLAPLTRGEGLSPHSPASSPDYQPHADPERHSRAAIPLVRPGMRGEGSAGRRLLVTIALGLMLVAGPAIARAPVILDFGDSLTAGLGLPANAAFPAKLEAWLHRQSIEVRVVNAGVSGDTTADGLARLDWALADKPDLVILALGANDALRGIDPSTVRDNLDKMIGKIEAAGGTKMLLLGMQAPTNWGEEYKRDFDRIFPDL